MTYPVMVPLVERAALLSALQKLAVARPDPPFRLKQHPVRLSAAEAGALVEHLDLLSARVDDFENLVWAVRRVVNTETIRS